MALPSDRDVQMALLSVINDAGGEARPRDIYPAVTARFPELTAEDLAGTLPSGANRWTNRIQWLRQKLVVRGEIAREPRGIWRITEKGHQRLQRGGSLESQPAPPKPAKVAEPPVAELEQDKPHRQLQKQLKEIGEMLGYYATTEYRLDPYQYDVIWKRDEWQPSPSNVFEVQHHGSLEAALLKLKHAHDVSRPKLCLVVTGERDQKKVNQILGPLFSGVFHEIRSETLLLTAEQVTELRDSLARHRDILRKMVAK